MNCKKTSTSRPFFPVGSRQQIFQRPISREEPDGTATLVKCTRDASQFDYPGVVVEEWDVRFDDDEGTYSRIVTAPTQAD